MIFVLFQTDSQPRNMRCKSWPDYKDWVTIFGKDRATGEAAKQFSDVASKQPHARKYNPGTFSYCIEARAWNWFVRYVY